MYYTFNCYTCKYTCISTHVIHMKHNTCITGVAEVASIVHQSKLFIFLNNLNKGVVNNSGMGGGVEMFCDGKRFMPPDNILRPPSNV